MVLSKALEITLERHRAERTEGRAWVGAPSYPDRPRCPSRTHGSQTIGRPPGVEGEPGPVATFTEPHPGGRLVPLGLLLTDPKELKMPSLVAQDHCLGGGNADSGRPL